MSERDSFEARLEAMERRLTEIQRDLGSGSGSDEPAAPATVDVAAGPFPTTDALREFECAVAGLPGVREVALRGYASGNRAILEVQLDGPTSYS